MYGQNLFTAPGDPGSQNPTERPLTVTELNSRTRRMLETQFGNVRVEGELSTLARPGSGHWYFTLKDTRAQIRCAMFKKRNQSLKFIPSEGMHVLLRGRVSLYEGRGDYQLIVDHMEDAGAGALQHAFEELKLKLANEGLFNAEHKRPLPGLPRHIGVVTSPAGAAVKDILSVLKRRFPAIPVTVIPAAVQGKEAAGQIAEAIATANKAACFDVLVVGRGGGSLEDLWPFNEEIVARAIAASNTPVVSAVGHEIDFTIADFVADYRAPTPSAAAEILSPDHHDWLHRIDLLKRKLATHMHHRLQIASQSLDSLSLRLRHPGQKLAEHRQRVENLDIRLRQTMTIKLQASYSRVERQQVALQQLSPEHLLEPLKFRLAQQSGQLQGQIQQLLERNRLELQRLSAQLNTVSPLATLSRGYSIVQRDGSDEVIQDARQLEKGDQIRARFSQGEARCRVEEISSEAPDKVL